MIDDLYTVDGDDTVSLAVHAQPGAGRTQITGRHGDALKIRVAAPPEHGRANSAVTEVLAEEFAVPAAAIELTAGERSRTKRFRITGIEPDEFAKTLSRLVSATVGGPGPGSRGDRRRPGEIS